MTKSIQEKTAAIRRQHIIQAVIKVFAERGFYRATIRDIANEAGVADGTIYNVFENKTALLLSILEPLGETGALDTPSVPGKKIQSFIAVLLGKRWETFTPEALQVLRIVLSEAMINEELRELFMKCIIQPMLTVSEAPFKLLADAGELKSDDTSMLLRSMTAMVVGLITLRLLGEDQT